MKAFMFFALVAISAYVLFSLGGQAFEFGDALANIHSNIP